MNRQLMNINRIPVPTWKWLHINSTSVKEEPAAQREYSYHPSINKVSGMTVENSIGLPRLPYTDMLKEIADYAQGQWNHRLTLTIPEGTQIEEPVLIDYILDETNPYLVNQVHVCAGANSSAQIHIRYRNTGKQSVFHCGHVCVECEKNARIKLSETEVMNPQDIHVNAVYGVAAEKANLHVILGETGNFQRVSACDITLADADAAGELDGLYAGSQGADLDMNYRITYQGKETEGIIKVQGALAGTAKKKLKSTIDFWTGARASKGREEESVLVLSDKVINISSPLLLCGEDYVDGQHATSIGRPDADQLYYLMTRGFSEMDARRLLVEASFAPLLAGISLTQVREELLSQIMEVVHYGT